MADLSTAKKLVAARIGQTQGKIEELRRELANLDHAFKILVIAHGRPHDVLEVLERLDDQAIAEATKPKRTRRARK